MKFIYGRVWAVKSVVSANRVGAKDFLLDS
jgi:hypothetical protein